MKSLWSLLMVSTLILGGCGGEGGVSDLVDALDNLKETDTTNETDTGNETVLESTSAFIDVQAIFTANCSPCHIAGTSGGLSLTEAYDNIVDVPSSQNPSLFLVNKAEANPNNSYLIMKIRGDDGMSGARMPKGRATLSDKEIATLVTWVEAGAVQ